MALQSSGQISLDDLHVEAGGSSGTECTLNDSDIRDLIDKSSGAQSAINEFYGASSVTVPVWNSSTKTFDLGTPDVIHTKTGNFTLAYNGACAIIAIGGGGGGGSEDDRNAQCTGGGGGGVAIKGLIGTTSMSFSASRGSGGGIADDWQNPYWNGHGASGGSTTVSGNGISLTANGGERGTTQGISGFGTASGGSASGGDANYTGGDAPDPSGTGGYKVTGGGGAGGGNGATGDPWNPSSGGSSPLRTGWLASYIGNGGGGCSSSYHRGGSGGSYGGGGGGGISNNDGTTWGNGGRGADGIILVCYWT